ncbi:olfactory receptor 1468-like [Alosa alosa]|uniref:olfactory receptor 1468-like n=1 Tax=Alosa sapidissima TaxID=34773 RepID=UPI001C0A14E2|nr:olfactory receptor 1468-like [Alosa sapidissima]XP_048121083.1 olfactory receptor 1468-like [Alosa alosa]
MMAYDRFISICFPLTYEKLMSPSNVIICIIFIWLIPFGRVTITLSITAIRVMLSLYFLILSPVLNPVIYGARTGKINEAIKAKIMNLKGFLSKQNMNF